MLLQHNATSAKNDRAINVVKNTAHKESDVCRELEPLLVGQRPWHDVCASFATLSISNGMFTEQLSCFQGDGEEGTIHSGGN